MGGDWRERRRRKVFHYRGGFRAAKLLGHLSWESRQPLTCKEKIYVEIFLLLIAVKRKLKFMICHIH